VIAMTDDETGTADTMMCETHPITREEERDV
jgi:hypothetical protein